MSNIRRFCTSLMALVLTAGTFACYPMGNQKNVNADTIAVSNDFETTYNGWVSTGNLVDVLATKDSGYQSNRGLKVSNRQTTKDGITSETELSNDSFTIPSDTKNMRLVVESANQTMNFYIDEAIATSTTISNSGNTGSSSNNNNDNSSSNTDNTSSSGVIDLSVGSSVDLSSYSNIGTIDIYTWWNSASATIDGIKLITKSSGSTNDGSNQNVDTSNLASEFNNISLYHSYKTDDTLYSVIL